MIKRAELKALCEGMHALYVEDDLATQAEVKITLGRIFEHLHVASNGNEGLALARECRPDIIISDIQMPQKTGLAMIEEIKAQIPFVCTIITTAFNDSHYFLQAIALGVDGFVLKPIDKQALYDAIYKCATLIRAQAQLEKEARAKVQSLEERLAYATYQEELTFSKELQMIRNDFYYKTLNPSFDTQLHLLDFCYLPKDLLSGDCYLARKCFEGRSLFAIVDGMGKGVSACVSALMCVAFLNHLVDRALVKDESLVLEVTLERFIDYVRRLLLEEEIVSVAILVLDTHAGTYEFASFSMPPLLLMDTQGIIHKKGSNNPPISRYTESFKVEHFSLEGVRKILFHSDGMSETALKSGGNYAKVLKEDFKAAMSRSDLLERMKAHTLAPEDDITFILINHISFEQILTARIFEAKLESLEEAGEWFAQMCEHYGVCAKQAAKSEMAFTELMMNAYEHGSLGMNKESKHSLIDAECYEAELCEREKEIIKQIHVSLKRFINPIGEAYLCTIISDEGEGFDTDVLKKTFGYKKQFNGRGVYMTMRSTLGIYFTPKGNTVAFLTPLF